MKSHTTDTGIFTTTTHVAETREDAKRLFAHIDAQLHHTRDLLTNPRETLRARIEAGDADAYDVAEFIEAARRAATQGDTEAVIYNAFMAGQCHQKMLVRPSEPAARTGRTVRDGSARGGKAKAVPGHIRQQIVREWNTLRRQNPAMLLADVDDRIAVKFGVAPSSVRNYRRKQSRQNLC